MSEFLPPVVAVLAADIEPYLAGLMEGQARMAEFVASQNAAITELEARFATLGAGEGLGGGMAAATAEMETSLARADEAVAKFGIDTKATAAEVDAAFTEMGVAVEATGAKISAMGAEEAAIMTELKANVAGMAAAQKEATLGQAALGDAMAGTAAKSTEANTIMGMSKGALVGVGAAAIGAAYETVKMAGDFNQATERLATSAGEDQRNIQMVRDGILSMAGAVGYSSDELAAAMYKVESGGQHAGAGLKVLQAAAEGAKTENADLTTVADALTSAMTDYKIPADQAATTTSKLVAATSQGKMTFEELAGSMSAILPVASANHVSLNDILGDLASMTVHGMSAQQATQNLADAIRHMTAPTQVQAKELASLGLNATEVSKSLGANGLSGTINEISDRIRSQMGPDGMVVLNLTNALKGMSPAVQDLGKKVLDGSMTMKEFSAAAKGMDVVSAKQVTSFAALAGTMHGIGTEAKNGAEVYQTYSDALKRAMGDATGMNVALMIGGENAGITANAIKVVSGATAEAGGHVKGWAEIQGEFNTKLAQAKDGLGAMAISIGEKLLPVLTPLVSAIATGAEWLAKHQTAAVLLAVVIGGGLVVALAAVTIATWTWFSALVATNLALIGIEAPIWAVIAVVVAVGLAVYEVIQHWRGIADFFKGVWHAVAAVFEGALDIVMAPLHAIARAWDDIMGGFQNPSAGFAKSVKAFDQFFIEIGQTVKKGFDAVLKFFSKSPQEMADDIAFGLGRATRSVVDFVTSLPQRFSDMERTLVQTGKNMMVGMAHGAEDGAKAVWSFMVALPGRTVTFVGNAASWLLQKGKDVLVGMGHGVEDGAKAVWDFLKALPGRVITFFADAPGWLYDAGRNILVGLWNGFWGKVGDILSGVGDFIHRFISMFMAGFAMSSPSQVMHNMGGNIIAGLWNGITGALGNLYAIPGQIFQALTGPFANSASWLVGAGENVIIGLGNGLSQLAGWLWSKASSIAQGALNAAKSALGIASPSTHATEYGRFLAQGLALGIDNNAHLAITAARSMAAKVTGAMTGAGGSAQLNVSGAGSGSGAGAVFSTDSGSGGGGAVTNLHVTVNGSVMTTQTLVKDLQTAFLRQGMRNVTPGIQYGFA